MYVLCINKQPDRQINAFVSILHWVTLSFVNTEV